MNCFYCDLPAILHCCGQVATKNGYKPCDRPLCDQHHYVVRSGVTLTRSYDRSAAQAQAFTIDYCSDCHAEHGRRSELPPGG